LVLLILLIIATAVLLAWLVMALGRLTFGDLHLPRLHPSPAAAPEMPAGVGTIAPERAPGPSEPGADTVPYDESDAEQAVREHLYGQRGRRGT
jgi:hypothetical protein